jgi:hypothetical protein
MESWSRDQDQDQDHSSIVPNPFGLSPLAFLSFFLSVQGTNFQAFTSSEKRGGLDEWLSQ